MAVHGPSSRWLKGFTLSVNVPTVISPVSPNFRAVAASAPISKAASLMQALRRVDSAGLRRDGCGFSLFIVFLSTVVVDVFRNVRSRCPLHLPALVSESVPTESIVGRTTAVQASANEGMERDAKKKDGGRVPEGTYGNPKRQPGHLLAPDGGYQKADAGAGRRLPEKMPAAKDGATGCAPICREKRPRPAAACRG
ncbi:hypothetical protein SAMN05192589_104390 [Paracidovorax valerianellae]|uniref:Uncharacterized protein n=1 Tax=Paracidovorax valerianellae TaxID=187868 RepID=A0A1G6SAM2_9BURK|nr:hypothetical protein SAMN05192589_104390 [Paracidovorax valerianellae]